MKHLFQLLVIVLASKQVFGATDEEVQQANAELDDAILDKVMREMVYAIVNNYTKLKENIAADAANGRINLQSKLADVTEKIKKIAERTNALKNIFVLQCGAQDIIDTLTNYSSALETKLLTCSDIRYDTGKNLAEAYWFEMAQVASCYLYTSYTTREGQACKGDAVYNDKILAKIAQSKEDFFNLMDFLEVDLLNSFDIFSVKCKDQILLDFDNYSSDMLEYFRSCVELETKRSAPSFCSRK